MSDFFKFPHTPHLLWLGATLHRDDKVLSAADVDDLLSDEVSVEEKVDGANLGFSLSDDGELRAQNRGQYLGEPFTGQFSKLTTWLPAHFDKLIAALSLNIIIFGEWCAAVHTIEYESLTDLFIVFDVYDIAEEKFWSISRRNLLAQDIGLRTVPLLARGELTVSQLKMTLNIRSNFRDGSLEGIVIRRESNGWCERRAKLVRPDFTQAITEHWRKRGIRWNQVDFKSRSE